MTHSEGMSKRKVFVLGDSRTGTMTIHKFLTVAGYRSIHFFFRESGVKEPAHADYDGNWARMRNFIDTSEFDAFTDYPTRTFYKELFATYSDALFILTTRRTLDVWKKSMLGFFGKFNMKLDIERLAVLHCEINDNIRALAISHNASFIEISIDDDAAENGRVLSQFIGLNEILTLGHENSTGAYDNRLWSSRLTIYNTSDHNFLSYVKRSTNPSKALLSEFGWFYLINDETNFLDFYFGDLTWNKEYTERVVQIMETRYGRFKEREIAYLEFVIPEKHVVYPEFLPKLFHDKTPFPRRPAIQLQECGLDYLSYPYDVVCDVKSYGHTYFRGDTRPNWLGSYFLYHHIVSLLNRDLTTVQPKSKLRSPIALRELLPTIETWGGDLFSDRSHEAGDYFTGAWKDVGLNDSLEHLVRLSVPDATREAQQGVVEEEIRCMLGDREVIRFSSSNRSLPKAVIFCDSSSDLIINFLAEHFSESLFISDVGRFCERVIDSEKPDVVLHLIAERFLICYGDSPAV